MSARFGTVVRPLVLVAAVFVVQPTAGVAQGVPAAPTLSAEFGGNLVHLQWDEPNTGYWTLLQIEVGSASGLTDLATITRPFFDKRYFAWNVPFGTYYVRVRSLVGAVRSPPSNEVVVTLAPCPPPPPPQLQGFVYQGEVVLLWNDVRVFGCGASSSVIEAGRSPGATDIGTFPHTSNVNRVSFPDVPFGTYYVRVRGVGSAGAVGPPSNEVVLSHECAAPPSIINPRADVVGNAARFSWQYSGQPASAYSVAIEAGSSPGGADVGVLQVPRDANRGFNAAAGVGTYYTRIRASNACGSTVSAEVPVTLTNECFVPEPIPFIDASKPSTPGGLNVLWTPASSGGLVMAYDIRVGSAPGLDDLARRTVDGRYVPSLFFSQSFTNINPTRAYVRIMPINTCGVALRAADASATGGSCPNPPAPSDAAAAVSGSAVTLTWRGTSGFEVPFSTYVEIGRSPLAADVLVSPTMSSSGTPSFTTTLPAGRYYARARRQNGACNEVSNASPEVTFVIP